MYIRRLTLVPTGSACNPIYQSIACAINSRVIPIDEDTLYIRTTIVLVTPPLPPHACRLSLVACSRQTPTGAAIVIEERAASELKTVAGTKIAPDGIAAWNPAFDVTPADLITAIVTDRGLVPRAEEEKTAAGEGKGRRRFDVAAFCKSAAAGEEVRGVG